MSHYQGNNLLKDFMNISTFPLKHTANLSFVAIAICLFLTGCAAPQSTVSPTDYPEVWQKNNSVETLSTQTAWWEVYQDEQLNQFMRQVFIKNADLAQAFLNIKKASLQAQLQKTNLLPQFSGALGSNFSKAEGGSTIKNYSANLSVSYEADIWGKIQTQVSAANLETKATQEDLEALRLSLSYQAVNLFYNNVYLEEAASYSQESVRYYEELEKILRARFENGVISNLEMLQAQQSLLIQKNLLLSLESQRKENLNLIKALLNVDILDSQFTFLSPHKLSQFEFQNIPADIPVSVLKSRPDVRAAEYRLTATLQNVDVVRLNYLPSLTLTGGLGSSSEQLGRILTNPVATLGAGFVLPFLNGAQRRTNIALAQTSYDSAVIGFRTTFLNALSEVDNALTNYQRQKAQLDNLVKISQLSVEIVKLNKLKYDVGVIGFKEYLDSQENDRQSQLNLIKAKYDLILNRAQIAKTVGGNLA